MKTVNLTEITEAMESMGFTSSYSAGTVLYTNQNGGTITIKDTDTLTEVLRRMYYLGFSEGLDGEI